MQAINSKCMPQIMDSSRWCSSFLYQFLVLCPYRCNSKMFTKFSGEYKACFSLIIILPAFPEFSCFKSFRCLLSSLLSQNGQYTKGREDSFFSSAPKSEPKKDEKNEQLLTLLEESPGLADLLLKFAGKLIGMYTKTCTQFVRS